MQQAVAHRVLYQGVHLMTHPDITDTVVRPGVVHFYLVGYLGFLRIFRVRIYLEARIPVEVTVFFQQILRHFDTYFRVDGRDKHRFGSQLLEYPFPYFPFLVDKRIVHPQAERERHTDRRAPQQGIIGGIIQGGFHFRQGIFPRIRFIFVGDFYLLDTGIQHFTFGKVLGSGAGSQE